MKKREPMADTSSPSPPQSEVNPSHRRREALEEAQPQEAEAEAAEADGEEEKLKLKLKRRQAQERKEKQKESLAQRPLRPSRACTARTPSRLVPDVAVASLGRRFPTPRQQRPGRPRQQASDGTFSSPAPAPAPSPASDPPMALLPDPPSPSHEPRWHLRSMWELATILHFLNVFRPILKLKVEFTIEDLESALLTPNSLLEELHIVLLKAIPPISRTPINSETWVALLCKKMKEWWGWVAEGPFPLASHQGNELAAYQELSPDIRVIILKALVEARTDQDDVRAFIDDMLKQGIPFSRIRKERTGIDMQGTTYWYENDPIAGQRLYRELRKMDYKDKPKIRGRMMPPPSVGRWETLATNLDEFQSVAEKLSTSRNRMEVAIAKRINNEMIPDLEDLQKKRERALKKQQRQSVLLSSYFSSEDLNAGRSKRERKPVTYTFDDYDKSISEAIKITKRRTSSPGSVVGGIKLSDGSPKESDDEANLNELENQDVAGTSSQIKFNETKGKPKLSEPTTSHSSESDEDEKYGRGRRRCKQQRYAEYDLDNAMSDSESEYSGEDDVEEEADNYVKKKSKVAESSDGDDEYRGEEEDEAEDDDDDDGDGDDDDDDEEDYVGSSDEEEYDRRRRSLKHTVSGRKRGRSRDIEQEGLRRSQRANKSHVNYSKYEESDVEGDEDMEDSESRETSDSDERRVDNREDIDDIDDSTEKEFQCTTQCPDEKNNKMLFVNQDLNLIGHPDEKNNMVLDSKVTGHPDDKKDVILSMTQDSNLNGYSDEKKGLVSREIEVGISGHQITINGVGHEPFEDVKPRSQLHRFLDLNVAAPAGGGLDDIPQPTGEARTDYHVF